MIYIFCAPSGSGKSTMVKHLLTMHPDLFDGADLRAVEDKVFHKKAVFRSAPLIPQIFVIFVTGKTGEDVSVYAFGAHIFLIVCRQISFLIHVSSSAGSITKELLRHKIAERRIEKIDYFRYYLREFVHISDFCECKSTAFLRHMQINITIFEKIA